MPIVLNEVKKAEEIISSRKIGDKPASTLYLLGRYYIQKQEMTIEETKKELDDFMSNNYRGYNSAKWEGIIENISLKAHRHPLRNVDYVGITRLELDTIKKVNNLKYQRLLFTMLCYAKLYNMSSPNNNGWVNEDISELYKIARVTVKHRNDKFLYINDLHTLGYISFSKKNNNLNLKVNFIDSCSDFVLKIHDFRELGYEYLKYLNIGRYINCAICNRLVRLKNKNDFSTKYCFECSRNNKNEQNKKYYKIKFRKSLPPQNA